MGKRKVISQEPEGCGAGETAETGQAAKGQHPEKPLDPESQQRLKSSLEAKNLPARKELTGRELFVNSF